MTTAEMPWLNSSHAPPLRMCSIHMPAMTPDIALWTNGAIRRCNTAKACLAPKSSGLHPHQPESSGWMYRVTAPAPNMAGQAMSERLGALQAVCCRPLETALSALVLPAMLAACQPDVEAATPQARPVRTVTTEKREAGVPVTLTGRI